MGEKVDETIQNRQGGACTFRIQGGLYHRIWSLLPEENATPKFSQIYIYDAQNELAIRYSEWTDASIRTFI
jgi:hypothetical protein